MTTASSQRRVWLLWGLIMALLAAEMALWLTNNTLRPQSFSPFPLLVPGFATVGAIVVARHRGHVIGWLFLAIAAATALGGFCEAYAIRAYLTGTLPAGDVLLWVTNWLGGLGFLPLGLLLLVFPTGRLPSRRWRPVLWVLVGSAAYQVFKFMLEPVLLLYVSQSETVQIANPVASVALVSQVILPYSVAVLSSFAALATAALAPLVRYRRAGQVERQQLKWLVFVLAVGVLGGLAAASLTYVVPGVANALAVVVAIELSLGIPFAVGAAILRYRLYDIDRLINRTLVYGLLTIVLGGLYAAMVLTLGQLAGRVGADPPSWAVAGATLAVAACFSRPATASRRSWTSASTGAATTPPRRSTPSAPGCATRSISTPSPPSCWRSWTRPCSRPRSRCGFDPPQRVPWTYPAPRQGQLPGPTELRIRTSGRCQPGCRSVKTPQRRSTSCFPRIDGVG